MLTYVTILSVFQITDIENIWAAARKKKKTKWPVIYMHPA